MVAPNVVQSDVTSGKAGSYLTFVPITLATLTAALQFTLTPKHKGRLLSARFHTHTPGTGTSATVTLTPTIGGGGRGGGGGHAHARQYQ